MKPCCENPYLTRKLSLSAAQAQVAAAVGVPECVRSVKVLVINSEQLARKAEPLHHIFWTRRQLGIEQVG